MGKTWKDGKRKQTDFGGKPKHNPKDKGKKNNRQWVREKEFNEKNWRQFTDK